MHQIARGYGPPSPGEDAIVINRILTVGGLTLLSRVTGFARDIVMAAVLGAGPIADAFLVAFRLPNHFRAIFAEGAFAAAFVPAYARIRTQGGADAAKLFGDRIFTLLLASQIVLLALALLFTPAVIWLLAPGFRNDPTRFELAVELTRITFPYLLLMTLVTLLLRHPQFDRQVRDRRRRADPAQPHHDGDAARPRRSSRPPGHAAAWGVLIAGVLEVLLVGGAALRADVMTTLRRPWPDEEVKRFFKALGPGDRRLGRRAACAVRRHHHRELPRGRRALGALLRRPALSVARRRDRHRGRHRAAARDGAAHRGRRRRTARAPRRNARSSSRCCSRSPASRRS